jgi:RNA polymerase sigma factor (sigma-70 family)
MSALTDADLWERYVQKRDEFAFEILVRRHGPMVLGVCRRILRNEADAEDAFQATFLVLVRRADSLQSPSTIANWLHGVASRTALEARSAVTRRRDKEAKVPPRAELSEDPLAELWPVLDQELRQLAEHYRTVVILCDLEGKTRKEAARELGCAEGTIASRLTRARNLLASRLARRGFAGVLGVVLIDGPASASVSAELVRSTVTAGLSVAKGVANNAVLSANVFALTEGVLKSMLITKIQYTVTVLLILAVAALGVGGLLTRTAATEPAQKSQTSPDDPQKRIAELKKQIAQIQREIARLEEEENQANRKDRETAVAGLVDRFKYRVEFETGHTETRKGGLIEIREVWGTRKTIELGGQYLVRGKYKLPPGEHGKLYFYATATGAWGQTATLDLQSIELDKQEGEFTLVHGMAGEGYFHLILTDPERYSDWFANVYFGTGENVLRKKP